MMETRLAHFLAACRNLATALDELDVTTMGKRVDALCAPNSSADIAEWLGVEAQALEALRQGRVFEPDSGAQIEAITKLAEATGAGAGWILGHTLTVVDDTPRLDLDLLASLDALLQTSSVAEAASRTGYRASTMAHRLAKLRDLFGDSLLIPAGAAMVLTPRARALAPRVRRIVADIKALATAGHEATPGRRWRMRLYRWLWKHWR